MPGNPGRFVPEQSGIGQSWWERRMAKFSTKIPFPSLFPARPLLCSILCGALRADPFPFLKKFYPSLPCFPFWGVNCKLFLSSCVSLAAGPCLSGAGLKSPPGSGKERAEQNSCSSSKVKKPQGWIRSPGSWEGIRHRICLFLAIIPI